MASVDKEDASPRTAMTDLAINLADKLLDAFQKVADGSSDGARGNPLSGYTRHEASDQGTENDNDDDDDDERWHQMVEEEDDNDNNDDDNDADEAGLGPENIETLISPIGARGFDAGLGSQESDEEGSDVIFTPTRTLQFDGSDGDDQPAVDQKFLPRGVFIESDFTHNRPQLHGSEEGGCTFPGVTVGAYLVDQSQNVRIIEGHDDVDKGAGFISHRNPFLYTQVVQLPVLTADDYQCQPANLYDSLERDDHFFPEDGDREHSSFEDGQDDNQRELVRGEGEMPGQAHQLELGDEDSNRQHTVGCAFDGQQFSSRLLQTTETDGQNRSDEGDMTVLSLMAKTLSKNTCTVVMIEANQVESQHQVYDEKDVNSARDKELDAQPFSASFIASTFVPAMSPRGISGDKPSGMGTEPNQAVAISAPKHGAAANGRNKKLRQEGSATTRSRNQQVSVPSRVGTGLSMGGDGNPQQSCTRVCRKVQRATAAGSSAGGPRSRVGVGSSAWQPAGGGGAQRPAVQGSASAQTDSQMVSVDDAKDVGGDGDGAGDGESDNPMATAQPGPVLGPLPQSRMLSQGSASAGNSHSRIGGVGKESNSSNNMPPSSRPVLPRPADNNVSGNGTRPGLPSHGAQPQNQLLQPPHAASARSTNHGHSQHGQKSKPAGKSAAGELEDRTLLLQKQKQLQHEHQMLLLQQKQLQQQIQQQQAPGLIRSCTDSEQIEYHQPDTVTTQVGHMQQDQLQRQPSKGVTSGISVEVQSVEDLRNQLQSILKQQKEASSFDHQVFDYSDSATDLLLERHGSLHDVDSVSVAGSLTRGRGYDEMPEIFDNFSSFSYKIFSDMSRGDTSSHSENAYLRDCLEKERYRRKHCELQIQNLNAKLLELQQQLVVAVSTDKRKDIMIDQLDKQLGKVVERWKRREAEKDEYMQMVMKEKLLIEETLQKQQTTIDSFEKDLARTVEELKQEKEKSAEVIENMKEELLAAVHARKHAEELLSVEKERVILMEKDWEQLKDSRDLAEKRAQQAQERLHEEQDVWYQREKELLSKIDQVKDANLKVMQMEREKHEQQTKKVEEMEEKLHEAQTDIKKLEMELDSAIREKESLRVEMAITEAKFENAQRTLEADLRSQMEKEISEQVNDVHEKMRAELEETMEKHRRTVSELHQRHQRELETQLAALRQEGSRKEEDLRQQLAEQEHQLSDYQQENTALKQARQKLESQRMEVLAKLQFIMQSQWNEAVSLLVSTPQRKNLLNNSVASSVGSASFSGLLPSQPGVLSNTGGSQLQSSAACLPLSSLTSPQKTSKQPCVRNQDESGSPQQISSSSSSPCASTDQLQVTSPRNRMNGSRQGSGGTRVPATHNSTGVSLEDIATLLSRRGQAPTQLTRNVHGVLHNSGLVIQPQRQVRETWPQQGPQAVTGSSAAAQAIMIHPPQQLSHPLQYMTDDFLASFTEDQLQEDFSFISTSDIPCRREDLSHRREQNGYTGHRSKGVERRNTGGTAAKVEKFQQQLRQDFDVDRGLALSDLESMSSQSTLRDAWRSQTGIHDGDREEGVGMQAGLHGKDSFPLGSRDQCLSPPVKQGRDGDQEAEGVLQESNRLNDSYKEISRQLEEHQARQKELQHYIKMLLDKPPRTLNEQPERDNSVDPDSLENSQDTVDSEMTEATQAVQISAELQRLQQLRSRQATELTGQLSSSQASQKKNTSLQPAPSNQPTGLPQGSLQAQQLAELTYLLSHYQEGLGMQPDLPVTSATTASSASITHILNFLASVPPQVEPVTRDGRQSRSARTSPRAGHVHRARDPHKAKKSGDSRHHSVGPETSFSVSTPLEKNDRSMASSVKSGSSRKAEKKLGNSVSVSTTASSSKLIVRPQGKDQPVWK